MTLKSVKSKITHDIGKINPLIKEPSTRKYDPILKGPYFNFLFKDTLRYYFYDITNENQEFSRK